jgi:hypothetical protein
MPNLQRSKPNRSLLQLNLPVESFQSEKLRAMTTKTQDIKLAARKLAKIAEQLSALANQSGGIDQNQTQKALSRPSPQPRPRPPLPRLYSIIYA